MKRKFLATLQENLRKDYTFQMCIDGMQKNKPYVDSKTGTVFWGVDSEKIKHGGEAHKKKTG